MNGSVWKLVIMPYADSVTPDQSYYLHLIGSSTVHSHKARMQLSNQQTDVIPYQTAKTVSAGVNVREMHVVISC